MIIGDEYKLRLERPDTFTYRNQRVINDLRAQPMPKIPIINNSPLEPRKEQNFIPPSPLPRKIPTNELLEQERMRSLMKNVTLTAEGLANFLRNTIFLAPKYGEDGNPLLDPISRRPIMQNTNLLNLLKTKGGIQSAIKILVDKLLMGDPDNPRNPNMVAAMSLALDRAYDKIKEELKNNKDDLLKDVLKNLSKLSPNVYQTINRDTRGPQTRPPVDSKGNIKIGDFIDTDFSVYFYLTNLSNIVGFERYVNFLRRVNTNPDNIINIPSLVNRKFWDEGDDLIRRQPISFSTIPRGEEQKELIEMSPEIELGEPQKKDIGEPQEEKQETKEGEVVDNLNNNPKEFFINRNIRYYIMNKLNYTWVDYFINVLSVSRNVGNSIKSIKNDKGKIDNIGQAIRSGTYIIKFYDGTKSIEILNRNENVYVPRS